VLQGAYEAGLKPQAGIKQLLAEMSAEHPAFNIIILSPPPNWDCPTGALGCSAQGPATAALRHPLCCVKEQHRLLLACLTTAACPHSAIFADEDAALASAFAPRCRCHRAGPKTNLESVPPRLVGTPFTLRRSAQQLSPGLHSAGSSSASSVCRGLADWCPAWVRHRRSGA